MIKIADKNPLEELLDSYGDSLSKRGKSRQSVLTYLNPNRQFIRLLEDKGVTRLDKVTTEHLTAFQQFLFDEKDFSQSSVVTFMKHVRMFFDYLVSEGHMKKNIARNLKAQPKPELPTEQLSRYYTYDEIQRRYLKHLKTKISFSYWNTVGKHLKGFFKYLRANNIKSVYVVTESTLLRYREFLWEECVHYHKDSLVVISQIDRLRCVVRLFRYLAKEGILINNPTIKIDWESYYKDIAEKAKKLPKRPEENNDLTELDKYKLKFLQYEQGKGKSSKTVSQYRKAVDVFFEYLAEQGVSNLSQLNKRLMDDYFMYVCNYIGVRGGLASNGYKNHLLWGVKKFFRYLVRFDYLLKDFTMDLEAIKEERGLPSTCMNDKEILDLINQPRLNHDPLNIRDKAILELLYSTAVRCNELCSLNIEDVDYQQEMVRVNNPKGGKSYQRVIPVGREALNYLSLYLRESRPQIENGDPKALFLSYRGHRLTNDTILNIVKKYAHECGFRKNITVHSFRVTCATQLHKNGAPIRYIQDMLGHKRITSTQRYTRLLPLDLKSIHRQCHPREKISSNCSLKC